MFRTRRIALPEFSGQRVARNAVEYQIMQRGQPLDVGVSRPTVRVRLPCAFRRDDQLIDLVTISLSIWSSSDG